MSHLHLVEKGYLILLSFKVVSRFRYTPDFFFLIFETLKYIYNSFLITGASRPTSKKPYLIVDNLEHRRELLSFHMRHHVQLYIYIVHPKRSFHLSLASHNFLRREVATIIKRLYISNDAQFLACYTISHLTTCAQTKLKF